MTAADANPVIDLRHGGAWHQQIGSEVGTVSLWVLAGKSVVASAGVAVAKPLLLPLLGGGLLWRWLHSRHRRPQNGRLGQPQPRPGLEPQPLTMTITPRNDSGRQICTVHHDSAGQITAIDCRQRAVAGPATIVERHAHPVG
jgi:hypothetical protein